MAEALAKIKDGYVHPATTGDTDGSLLTNLIEALTAGAQLNVGQKGRTTHSPTNYTKGGDASDIVDNHLAGIDTALGLRASTSHKDTHKSGDTDAFASSDLLEAVVKRLQVTGPVTLTVGACADGKYLKRSGSTLVGDDPPGMSAHALGGSYHSADTLANLNSKITLGDLDFDTAARPAIQHALGSSVRHSADSLANVNALITGGSLDFSTASRPPSGTAGGALTGSYPNPDIGCGFISAASTYSCTNTAWEDITTMSLTPAAGKYLVLYNCWGVKVDTNSTGYFGLAVDTTLDADSERRFAPHGLDIPMSTQGELTVNGSQAIKARAKVANGATTFTHYYRSLVAIRITD